MKTKKVAMQIAAAILSKAAHQGLRSQLMEYAMGTNHTRRKRLLVTAIGAAVVGITVAAAPAAVAEESGPNGGNHIPITPGELHQQPQPKMVPATQPKQNLPPLGGPHPGGPR